MEKSYSQYGQDKYVQETFFPDVKNGFFMEIGADDGIDKSNTYAFELEGWSGICFEPSPSRFGFLQKNRKCECINRAVSSDEKSVEFLDMSGYGKGLSGIVDNYDPKHIDRIERETKDNPLTLSKNKVVVQTVRLDKILAERNITRVDYCSIDVEGSELEILKSIDFTKVFFGIFTIEENYENNDVKELMERANFELVRKIGPDLVYRNRAL